MNPSYSTQSSTATDAPAQSGSSSAPATAKVSLLDAKHPYWALHNESWTIFDLLYRGGQAIKSQAARFLTKRPKEVTEVYTCRLADFDYQNILGTALGWYQSTLFRKDPSIDIRLQSDADPEKLPDARKKPYTDFLEDCDRNGTGYIDLWRDIFLKLVLFKGCYVCVDLPRLDKAPANLAEQRAAGGLDPYLMVYGPQSVINWERDEFGNLNWVVIKIQTTRQQFLSDGLVVDRWYYYDRNEYRIYERTKIQPKDSDSPFTLVGPDGKTLDSGDQQTAKLVDSGPHALADQKRVPVRHFEVPEGLWLASRAFLPACTHINVANSYYWALKTSNLPIPVITDDTEMVQTLSETAYIQLSKDGKFQWSEPSGRSYEASAKCLGDIREEIYRSIYLQAMGRSASASASSLSGYSKDMDWMPSKDVLAAYGDGIRQGAQNLLQDVALVRGDADIGFDVRGFNFEVAPALQLAEELEILISLDLPSDTFIKQKQVQLAQAALPDANRAVLEKVAEEINASPTRDEIAAQQQQAMKLSMDRSLNRSVTGLATQTANQSTP